MKKVLLIIILVFSMQPLQAQNPGPNVAWQKCFSTSGSDWFSGVVENPRGGYYSVAYLEKTDNYLEGQPDSGFFLIKFDVNFNVLWKRRIPLYATEIIVESNGDIMLAGITRRFLDPQLVFANLRGGRDLALLKLDSTGQNILWAKAYGSSGEEDQLFDLIRAGNGYIFSGSTFGASDDIPMRPCYNGFLQDAVFMKVDSVGNLQWVKTYGGSGGDGAVGSIIRLADGNFSLLTYGLSSDCDFSGTDPWDYDLKNSRVLSVMVDINGNEIKRKIDDSGRLTQYFAKTWRKGNKLYGVGYTFANVAYSPNFPDHKNEEGMVVEFDEDLNVYRQKLFGGNGHEFFFDHVEDALGNHIFFGATNTADNSGDIQNYKGGSIDYWILKTDSNFNTIWSRTLGSNGVDGSMWFNYPQNKMILRGSELILVFHLLPPPVVPNGDVACGTYIIEDGDSSRPAREAWIIAFDLTTGVESSKKEISSYQIFPNPSSGIITIKNSKATNRELKLKVTNQEGRRIKELQYLDHESYSFSVEDLSDGQYILQIFKARKVEYAEKIIIRR